MFARKWAVDLAAVMVVAGLAQAARGEIVSIHGSASAAIQEHKSGADTRSGQASDAYPDPTATLPLQVVARLADVENEAAGSVAAQFADPTTAQGPNPEEFAINLTLNSLSPEIYYAGQASTEEVRDILLRPADVGLAATGQTVQLRGRLFLDGILAVFAVADAQNLTGVTIAMRVIVAKEVEGAEPVQVFAGTLTIAGGTGQQVNATVEGDFPTSGILDADLAAIDPELGVFRAFVLPNLILDYTYAATVGQPFSLRATVEIDAANQPNGTGLVAILGTPLETLQEVITLTRNAATAQTMTTALEKERQSPTGVPAFPEPSNPLPRCGLFGFEGVLALFGLVALRARKVKT
jgi:hypothetical protein